MQDLDFAKKAATSSNLSATMRTPWGQFDAKESLSLSRAWSDNDQIYLSLLHSQNGIEQDYSLGFVLPDQGTTYLLIQAPDSWWDPEIMDPPQTLLKVVSASTVRALDELEFESALKSLESEVASRVDQTASHAWQELKAGAKELFGQLLQEAPARNPVDDWPFQETEDDLSLQEFDQAEQRERKAAERAREWLGVHLDEYSLEELLADGPYSWVFKGIREQDNSTRAFKIARPFELSGIVPGSSGGGTRGLVFTTGGIGDVHPDPHQLLAAQAQKLQSAADPALISIESFDSQGTDCYLRMEYLNGSTLRELASRGPVSLQLFVKLLDALDRLSRIPDFEYHGDIKPENIMIDHKGEIRLLDPGYFGPLDCQEGNYGHCMVTTPAYYPLLTPDDVFAVGIMLWEIACKEHPLDGASSLDEISLDGLEDDLIQWVKGGLVVGQYYLIPILQVGRPSQIRSDLSSIAEQVLLKAMRLRVTQDDKIGRDPGFANFSDFADALRGLIALGIKEL